MPASALLPCPGCGALFPRCDGPTHGYIGASSGCWALFCWSGASGADVTGLVAQSRIPDNPVPVPAHPGATELDSLWGDAYGVQHHGDESPQAIQSVAVHLLNLHGIISGQTTSPRWPLERALRMRGIFQKLEPPALGSALTLRHLFLGGGVISPVTRGQYVLSVYEAWMAHHRVIVEQWYERYVVPDQIHGSSSRAGPVTSRP
jgi:hypothetical protein